MSPDPRRFAYENILPRHPPLIRSRLTRGERVVDIEWNAEVSTDIEEPLAEEHRERQNLALLLLRLALRCFELILRLRKTWVEVPILTNVETAAEPFLE